VLLGNSPYHILIWLHEWNLQSNPQKRVDTSRDSSDIAILLINPFYIAPNDLFMRKRSVRGEPAKTRWCRFLIYLSSDDKYIQDLQVAIRFRATSGERTNGIKYSSYGFVLRFFWPCA
jgi:hypothetical protein